MRIKNDPHHISPRVFYRGHFDASSCLCGCLVFGSAGFQAEFEGGIDIFHTPVRFYMLANGTIFIFVRLKAEKQNQRVRDVNVCSVYQPMFGIPSVKQRNLRTLAVLHLSPSATNVV